MRKIKILTDSTADLSKELLQQYGGFTEYIDFITATLAVLPPYLLPFATLGISITVIAMLIRQEII